MTELRLRQAIETAAATLSEAGIDSARTDAELLAAHVIGCERGRLATVDTVEPGFLRRFEDLVRVRASRKPLQHITGTAAFGPVCLTVGPGVFIPRPETEALLEWALAQRFPESPVIVDLCTGSGALAVALAACITGARITAVDDDPDALAYARRNADGTPVQVIAGDVADPGLLPDLAGVVDLVVANPPYIPAGARLEPEVALHDPAHALFGGPDGMAVIADVVARAAEWLTPGGLLAVEHDDTTSAATAAIITGSGCFEAVAPHTDLTGRSRFVTARRTERRS